ncbi:hypothetical protein [Escherichia phage vB_EcoM_JNE01]|nr:hypothetical protein [Escherichia phage vB_EcoM_JNE01]
MIFSDLQFTYKCIFDIKESDKLLDNLWRMYLEEIREYFSKDGGYTILYNNVKMEYQYLHSYNGRIEVRFFSSQIGGRDFILEELDEYETV